MKFPTLLGVSLSTPPDSLGEDKIVAQDLGEYNPLMAVPFVMTGEGTTGGG